jgi:GcrA cell cycle regulator
LQTDWAQPHCDALREYLAKGMSHAEAARAINEKFGTAYTRNAAIGRAKRMGLSGSGRGRTENGRSPPRSIVPRLRERHARQATESKRPTPVSRRAERINLRCVQIVPRHLSVLDLEAGDCRYPYGGDDEGEPISFCGHPQHEGSSYCIGHFHLTRGCGTASERAAVPVALRLVQAA